MSKKTTRALVSTIVIGGALALLLSLSLSEAAQYYKHVDEVMVSPEQWYGKNLQLHGFVVDDSHLVNPKTLEHRFSVRTGAHVVNATFTGVVPDTFKDGSEVVLTGRLSPSGFQVAPGGVMAKCPSKYEAGKTGAAGK
jgi:cytochrome c-type biogenesis protein CcmE